MWPVARWDFDTSASVRVQHLVKVRGPIHLVRLSNVSFCRRPSELARLRCSFLERD